MEKTRSALIDAYVRLGCAQGDILLDRIKTESSVGSHNASPTSTTPSNVTSTDLEFTVSELQKFVEITDAKVRRDRYTFFFTHC